MKALIIASHGSRKKESNLELEALTANIAKKIAGKSFDRVENAFFQFAEPLFENTIEELVQAGATMIVIFPFFIGSGNHILVGIPRLIKAMQKKYEHIEFKLTRHIAKIEAIEDIIIQEVS